MKNTFQLLSIFWLLVSCQVEGELTRTKSTKTLSDEATLIDQGVFVPTSGISVSGEARVYLENGQYKVTLHNFSISSGPDLKVYLSKAATPTQFVNLGNLSSQTVYPIPNGVDVSVYSHVLIHCQQYNHLFAIAELDQN